MKICWVIVLKNNLTSFEILNLNLNSGLKNFLTNIIKKTDCIKPAIDTPYDKKMTNFSPKISQKLICLSLLYLK